VIISQTAESLPRIAETVTRGGIIAFRTDTLYGLGADPFNRAAVEKIKQLKGREHDKPILVLISNAEQTARLIPNRSEAFVRLTKQFWPGALTVIGSAAADLPKVLTAGTKTVGMRLPDDDRVRALVRACGGALTATSANLAGRAPARTAQDVQQYFGDQIDLIVDGGEAESDQPSTVIEATTNEISLIREGLVPWPKIQSALK
jgi:L-threonylcarbamoyladenylate synthase